MGTKKYVNKCLESTWISSKGRFIIEFEQKFANYTGVKHAASVCNGTVALHQNFQLTVSPIIQKEALANDGLCWMIFYFGIVQASEARES